MFSPHWGLTMWSPAHYCGFSSRFHLFARLEKRWISAVKNSDYQLLCFEGDCMGVLSPNIWNLRSLSSHYICMIQRNICSNGPGDEVNGIWWESITLLLWIACWVPDNKYSTCSLPCTFPTAWKFIVNGKYNIIWENRLQSLRAWFQFLVHVNELFIEENR